MEVQQWESLFDWPLQPDVVDVFVESAGVTVSVRGDRAKPAILTYHDLGLNAVSNFQAFSNFPEVGEILKNFCVYNVNAPGMEENAQSWPEEEPYPDMDQLADQVGTTMRTFSVFLTEWIRIDLPWCFVKSGKLSLIITGISTANIKF